MAAVQKINLKIPQGTTYVHEFNYVDGSGDPIDLTGYTARMQFREGVGSASYYYQALSGGDIEIDAVQGKLTLTIPSATCEGFSLAKSVYDIEIIAPNTAVTRIVKGSVALDLEVTR